MESIIRIKYIFWMDSFVRRKLFANSLFNIIVLIREPTVFEYVIEKIKTSPHPTEQHTRKYNHSQVSK